MRKVLVAVPIRVYHGDRSYMLLNVMHTGTQESVDIPHVWLEVAESEMLEESRTMARSVKWASAKTSRTGCRAKKLSRLSSTRH